MPILVAMALLGADYSATAVQVSGLVRATQDGKVWHKGSGVVVYSDEAQSVVLTCEHVVRGAKQYWVGVPDDRSYPAKLLAAEKTSVVDLALLEVRAGGLPYAPLATRVREGVRCRQAGYPGGGRKQRRRRGRFLGYFFNDREPGVDFECRPGDSGSAIYNEAGEVVAIVWGGVDGKSYGTSLARIRRWVRKHDPVVVRDWSQW